MENQERSPNVNLKTFKGIDVSVEYLMDKDANCPVESRFFFDGQCPINSCQFYTTNANVSNGCIKIAARGDRVEEDRIMWLKNMSAKEFVPARKKAFEKSHAGVIFWKYYEYCRKLPQFDFSVELLRSKTIKEIVRELPLQSSDICPITPQVLYQLLNEENYTKFAVSNRCQMCGSFTLAEILNLDKTVLEKGQNIMKDLVFR